MNIKQTEIAKIPTYLKKIAENNYYFLSTVDNVNMDIDKIEYYFSKFI